MHDRRPLIHSNTPRAARTLLTEIDRLRADIHQQREAIADLETAFIVLAQELRQSNLARRPRYLPADSE